MRRIPLAGVLFLTVALPSGVLPTGAAAQEGGWDSPRVLEMIAEARVRRAQPYQDSGLMNYSANAGGYVYFYLDREDEDELTLVKVDQVALEVYWQYPGSTKQRIVGLRDESMLPNRMRYHLDHLTIVQNEFGDEIKLGDGDEVRSVVHPVAPESEGVYNFRLADSLTLRLGGLPEPLRVYEVEVRPENPGAPGFVGSVFLDAATSDIVRMDFTFTRSSYVDQRLDYIRITLENGLWEGRFWLPYQQRAELRRQVPELDFPAGAVIRANMRVTNYAFNQELPPSTFRGPPVSAAPRAQRENYPFEDSLFAELSEFGLEADPDLEELREEAAGLVGRRWLEGLPRLRVDARGASSVLRFNRTERLHLGLGVSYRIAENASARVGGGYSFGTGEPSARAGVEFPVLGRAIGIEGFYNEPRDWGYPSIAGAMNTLSSAAAELGADFGHDFLDTYFVRGGSITLGLAEPWSGNWSLDSRYTFQHEVDPRALVDGFEADPSDELDRPLADIDDGIVMEGDLLVSRRAPEETNRRWQADIGMTYGYFEPDSALDPFGRIDVDWRAQLEDLERAWNVDVRARAGGVFGAAPRQRYYRIGGRGTVPGYAYRSVVADLVGVLDARASRGVLEPWLSARVSAAYGWSDIDEDHPLAGADGSLGPSVGVGIGIVHDILWLDLHRGLGSGGDWELLLSVDPELWDIL